MANIDILLYVTTDFLHWHQHMTSNFSIKFVQSDLDTGNVLPSGSSIPAKDAKYNQSVHD